MLDEELIQKLIGHIFHLWKEKATGAGAIQEHAELPVINKKGKFGLPRYYLGYEESVLNYEHIRVHGEKGVFPKHLFLKAAPNQELEEFEYAKENYKQITLTVYADFLNTIKRAFTDPASGVTYNTEKEDSANREQSFEQYVKEEIPTYSSVENYIKMVVPDVRTLDAEGVIAVKPLRIPTTENEEGELVVSSTELISPAPVYYNIRQIVAYREEEFTVIELLERSKVSYFSRGQKVGRIYEVYDKNTIWRVTQVGKFIDAQFEIAVLWQHDLGYLPVHKLMGIPKVHDERLIYQSSYLFAVDLLDLVALNGNYLQQSMNNVAYPYRVMLGQPCEFEDPDGNHCDEGFIMMRDEDGESLRRMCAKCNGTGLITRISRTGQLLLKPQTNMEAGELRATQKPLEYISPQTASLEFMRTKTSEDEIKARRILHLNTTETIVKGGEDETATGRAIDHKSMFAFIKPQADQIFTIWKFILKAIGDMRYGDKFVGFDMTFPKQFDLETDEDILRKLKDCIEAGMPPAVVAQIILNYVNAIFGNSKTGSAAYKLIIQTDRLITFSNEEINKMQALRSLEMWERVLHDSALTFTTELVNEHAGKETEFFDLKFADQQDALRKKAQNKAAELPTVTQATETKVDELAES